MKKSAKVLQSIAKTILLKQGCKEAVLWDTVHIKHGEVLRAVGEKGGKVIYINILL